MPKKPNSPPPAFHDRRKCTQSQQTHAKLKKGSPLTEPNHITKILGIESSCDETAAAIVTNGQTILSNVVASQIDIHRKYGGVVPEIASREHLRRIVPVVREAAAQASMNLRDIDAVAVTRGPGLVGSLIVGVTYGKALAMSLGKPLIPINHLEGHVHAVLLEAHQANRAPNFPAVCLIVSGGHTILYRVIHATTNDPKSEITQRANDAALHYGRIGGTRDDAAGEAYDKVAKMLALGYPGGPIIDQLAPHRRSQRHPFRHHKNPRQRLRFQFQRHKNRRLLSPTQTSRAAT